MLVLQYIEGAIAEREHRKWEHADVDANPDSPYTPAALQCRLAQGQQRPDDITRLVNAQSPTAAVDAEVAALSDQPSLQEATSPPVHKPDISR